MILMALRFWHGGSKAKDLMMTPVFLFATNMSEKALQAAGHATKRSYQSYAFAGVHGISLWDGVPEGGADPQRDGYAAGV